MLRPKPQNYLLAQTFADRRKKKPLKWLILLKNIPIKIFEWIKLIPAELTVCFQNKSWSIKQRY